MVIRSNPQEIARRDVYSHDDPDGWLVQVLGADGKKIDRVREARPLSGELVVSTSPEERLVGAPDSRLVKMPFTLVHGVTGAVIDDRAAR